MKMFMASNCCLLILIAFLSACTNGSSFNFASEMLKSNRAELMQIGKELEKCDNLEFFNGIESYKSQKYHRCPDGYSTEDAKLKLTGLGLDSVVIAKKHGIAINYSLRNRSGYFYGPIGSMTWLNEPLSEIEVKKLGFIPLEKCPCHWMYSDD